MIHLNLLPPDLQQRLRTQAKLIRWRSALLLAFAMVVLGNAVLGGTQWWLTQQQTQRETGLQEQQAKADASETGVLRQTTRKINAHITMLTAALPKARPWAHDLAKLAEDLPPKIQLTELELTVTNSVTISGVAETRSDFLVLDEFLRTHQNLTNLETDSQASQREDLPFTYTATWTEVAPS